MKRVLIVLLAVLAVALIATGISSYRKKHQQQPADTVKSAPIASAPVAPNPEILQKLGQMREKFDKENAQKEQFKSELTQGIADFNSTLPKDLGDYLTLTNARVVGKQVEFYYTYAGPPVGASRDALYTAINAFACGNAESREIMSNGFSIAHRVRDADGRGMIDTQVDLKYCGH